MISLHPLLHLTASFHIGSTFSLAAQYFPSPLCPCSYSLPSSTLELASFPCCTLLPFVPLPYCFFLQHSSLILLSLDFQSSYFHFSLPSCTTFYSTFNLISFDFPEDRSTWFIFWYEMWFERHIQWHITCSWISCVSLYTKMFSWNLFLLIWTFIEWNV